MSRPAPGAGEGRDRAGTLGLLLSLALHAALVAVLVAPVFRSAAPAALRAVLSPAPIPEKAPAPAAPKQADQPPQEASSPAETSPEAVARTGESQVPTGQGGAPGAATGEKIPEAAKRISRIKSPFYRDDVETVHVGQGEMKGGAEGTLMLRALADYSFEPDEFCGFYQVDGEHERYLNVIDDRPDSGGLVFTDSGTGRTRRLAQFSKYIFTHGPSFEAKQPVDGSIMFLPRKPFEGTENVDSRSRLLWQPKEPPAIIATKITFREKRMAPTDKAPGGVLYLLPKGGPYPAAVWLGDDLAPGPTSGLGRECARRGLALFAPVPPLGKDQAEPTTPDISAGQAVSEARRLAREQGIAPAGVGLWGRGRAALAALAAADGPDGPAFAACVLDAPPPEEAAAALDKPSRASRTGKAGPPVLILSPAGPTDPAWAPFFQRLDNAGLAWTWTALELPDTAALLPPYPASVPLFDQAGGPGLFSWLGQGGLIPTPRP